MKNKIIAFTILIILSVVYAASAATTPRVAFIFMGDQGPFTLPATDFAKKAFNATMLNREDMGKTDLTKYAVVWWHEGDSDPGALKDQELNAFTDYAKAGGAVLLSAWAIRYATPMGLENAEARQFGPTPDDGVAVGVIPLKETINLPIWNGLKNINGEVPKAEDRIQVNSTGYPKSGDYFDLIWKNFITVANVWGPPENDWADRIAAFGYWKLGKGKVFNMNWRLPNFHANNKDIKTLEKLTDNLIRWLASESLFFAVNDSGKLAATWGSLKK